MAYYLSMDGVDDYLTTPSMTYDEVVLDFSSDPTGWYKYYFSTSAGNLFFNRDEGYELWTYESIAKYNGADPVLVGGLFTLPTNTRGVMSIKKDSGTGTINIFANQGNAANMRGILYRVTLKLVGVTVAHYDMSTQTVQDQSGNGNHATLSGGTWVNDSAGTNYPVSLSDSLTLSETVSKLKSIVIIDTVSMSDSKSDKTSKSFSDTVTVSDSVSSTKGKAVSLSDSVIITDTIKKAVSQLKADSVTLADADSKAIIKAFGDSLSLSDSISVMKGKAVFLSDSLDVADSIKKIAGKLQLDSLSLSDSASRQANVTARLYDVVLVSDSVQVLLPNAPSIYRVVEISGGVKAVIELKGEAVISVERSPISLEGDGTPTQPAELRGEV